MAARRPASCARPRIGRPPAPPTPAGRASTVRGAGRDASAGRIIDEGRRTTDRRRGIGRAARWPSAVPLQGGPVSTFWLELLGGEIRYYDAAGVRTRALEAGSGPPLLLLHGTGGHAESWIRNVLPLSADFHVYAVDMV